MSIMADGELFSFDSAYGKTFRPYQADVVAVVGRGPDGIARHDWLVEMPTGAGKTTIAIAILAELLGGVFTHAIVCAPMTQIEDGFVIRQPTRLAWPVEVARDPVDIPAGFVRAARDGSEESTCREIVEYLDTKNPGYVLATTHAAISRLVKNHADQIPAKLKRCLLVVDEAHRAPVRSDSNALSKAVKLWSERKGRLLHLTATPHRTDGLPVKPEGMREYRRSMAEHSEGGFYSPEHFRHGIVLYGPDDIELTWKQLTGQELNGDARVIAALAARMVKEWIADGRPKAIVFVPPIRGGSANSIRTIIEAFRAAGARTLDASGVGRGTDGIKHQTRFLDALRAERDLKTYDESRFDVIVGGPRLPEGTDWPFCSTVYSVGVSGSMREAVQLIGRATRHKSQAGYPEQHRNVATMKSFVSAATGKALEKMSLEHSRLVLVTCVFMADYQAAAGFVLTKAVREALGGGASGVLGGVDGPPIQVTHGLDNETYAAIKFAMGVKTEEAKALGKPTPPYGELWDAGRKAAPDAPDRALDVIVAGFIAAGKDADRAVKFICEKLGPEMTDIGGALREMVAEFREVRAGEVAELERIGVQVHGMTGGGMHDLANKFPTYYSYEFRGKLYTVKALALETGISEDTLYTRLKRMTAEEAVTGARRSERKKYELYGETYTIAELSMKTEVKESTLRRRLKTMTAENAVVMELQRVPYELVFAGERHTLSSLSKKTGISASALRNRLKSMSVEEAITFKPFNASPNITYHGKIYSISELSRETGIMARTLTRRMKIMTVEEAINYPKYSQKAKREMFGNRTQDSR